MAVRFKAVIVGDGAVELALVALDVSTIHKCNGGVRVETDCRAEWRCSRRPWVLMRSSDRSQVLHPPAPRSCRPARRPRTCVRGRYRPRQRQPCSAPISIAEQSDPRLPVLSKTGHSRARNEGGRRVTACMRWRVDSFDHLVGERKHRRRDFQAQRFGGLEVQA